MILLGLLKLFVVLIGIRLLFKWVSKVLASFRDLQ
jgi:hypothetical protein